MSNKDVDQVDELAASKTLQDKQMIEVGEKIKDILESYNFALQPFISYSEYGIVPRVRLVVNPNNPNNTNDKGTDTDKAGEPQVEGRPAQTE